MIIFLLLFKAPYVYDWKHQQKKVKKYAQIIKNSIEVGFYAAENCSCINKSSASFQRPTIVENENLWQYFDNSKSFPFNETKGDWYSFKGTLPQPKVYDPSIHHMRFIFDIGRKYLVRRWDDDFPAGPEGRFWVNGKLIGAIDEFHNGFNINETGMAELRLYTARCRSSHSLNRFGVQVIHSATEELYHYLFFMKRLYKEIPEESLDRQKIMDITNQVLPLIDIRDLLFPIELNDIRKHDINKTNFYKSVPIALNKLKSLLKELPQHTENDPFINVIGYSHLDTCWEWPYNLSHYKFANTAASMLHLLDDKSNTHTLSNSKDLKTNWKYLATSSQHYKWCEKDDPELFKRIIDAAKEGKWEVDGASFVEPDTNLPSSESLVRQILYGTSYFNKLGFKQSTFFVPDCFGFTPSLPQILNLCDIHNFVTSKISWNEYNTFPYDTFKWRGIDGSEVIAHFITTPCQWAGQASTYTGVASANELVGTYKQYKQKIVPQVALHTAGNGDGGGGVTDDMLWNMAILNDLPKLETVPHIKYRTLRELFDVIRENEQRLPTWDGELYLEYHRGTATTQEEVKRQNKLYESMLHNIEWLLVVYYSLNASSNKEFIPPELKEKIDTFWEQTLVYQFHDALPGTSVNEANVDILVSGFPTINQLFDLQQSLATNLSKLMRLATEDNTQIIFNTLGHARHINETLDVPSGGWTSLILDDNSKNGNNGVNIDSFNVTYFERVNENDFKEHNSTFNKFISTKKSDKIAVDEEKGTVTTKCLFIEFDKEKGLINQITDVNSGRKFLKTPGNILEFYEDRPNNWPAWDIQLYHKEMQLDSPKLTKIQFTENAVLTEFIIDDDCDNETKKTKITQKITFSNDLPIIDFTTDVLWNEHDKLLKVCFPTTIRSKKAKYGVQFGHHERPTHTNLPQDYAMFEVNGRWSDLSDGSGGISLMSDVKHGFDIHNSTIRMSLLKSPLQTDRWADYGKRHFTYRLFVHNKTFEDSHVYEQSDELITQPVMVKYEQPTTPIDEHSIPMSASFVTSSNPAVVIETLKPSENLKGFVCRIYEANGGWQSSKISFPLLNKSEWRIKEVNLLEESTEESPEIAQTSQDDSIEFSVEINAFQIKTFLFEKL